MEKTSDALKILKDRYIGDDPERNAQLAQAIVDAQIEAEMVIVEENNDRCIRDTICGLFALSAILVVIKYAILSLFLL